MCHLHTITACAILVLTFSFTSFHRLTPISGALFFVNITTSSTNVRLFSPHGPPRFTENWIFSFWERESFLSCSLQQAPSRYHVQFSCHHLRILTLKLILITDEQHRLYFRNLLIMYHIVFTLLLLYFPSMTWPFCRMWVTTTITIIRCCTTLLECFMPRKG